MDDRQKNVGLSLGAGGLLGVLYGIDPVKFAEILSDTMAHEYMRIAAMFTVIAFFHRQGMKKDMAGVTSAIQNLGDALREDLGKLGSEVVEVKNRVSTMGGEIVLVKDGVSKLNTRVDTLEKLKE